MSDRPLSIPDRAARLVAKRDELEDLQAKIRTKEGDWTTLSLAGGEAMNAAHEALQSSWNYIDRLCQLARVELERNGK
ncbi:hypothetical protein [Variovorax boronicumulans]|uniref:hypothetical protein n=1 Tax=Variovorax boronicumulans TaxID=436515 RepID=UPI0012E5899A|nr:hypothetical protein [Variovorax boronicumulans]GER16735.1 hypothetical protein VCH24_17420 [Variovorax boronicumulans]